VQQARQNKYTELTLFKSKYYLSGNGTNCWSVDIASRGQFELVKQFQAPPIQSKYHNLDTKQQEQQEYLKCKLKALRFMLELMQVNHLEAIGGKYDQDV
jgi:hypothetical protein